MARLQLRRAPEFVYSWLMLFDTFATHLGMFVMYNMWLDVFCNHEVTWGHKDFGSALGGHKDFLKDVTEIVASGRAFAAILKDGTVISWGDKKYGGDCSAVKDRLKDVRSLAASFSAFAAICGGGHVVSWGNEASGGSCENVKEKSGKGVRCCEGIS